MRKMLMCLGLLAIAAPAMAEETGTRVEVKVSTAGTPEPEKLIQSLFAIGSGERQVKFMKKKLASGEQLTIDLWGATIPQSEIPSTLRQSFPELASAQITVSSIPASEKPKADPELRSADGGVVRKRVIKKEVVKEE